MSLIEVENISFTYPMQKEKPQAALRNVTLKIEAGEKIAIIGSNGSGKTTLARHLNALFIPTSGRVLVKGMDTRLQSHHQKIRSTVGMVFQQPEDQMIATIVEEDVAFGLENLGLTASEIRRRIDESLSTVGLLDQRLRPPHLLSAGQMQRVALAGILAMQPDCIIFDEATAMLDPSGRRMVLRVMDDLHQAGLTIIYITHFMNEAARANRIIVLDRGEIVMDGSPASIFSNQSAIQQFGLVFPPAALVADQLRKIFPSLPSNLLTVNQVSEAFPEYAGNLKFQINEPDIASKTAVEPDDLIQVEHLHHTYLYKTPLESVSLEDISISIPIDEIHGLIGATGSGKSTLLQHLNGLILPQSGRVQVGTYHLSDAHIDLQALRRYAGLVFQNPENQIFEQYVGDEIAYGPRLQGLKGQQLRERVQQAMQFVGLDFETFKDRFTFSLSGGERRKVALASTLANHPSILLLDEPTASLDPLARSELLKNLQALNQSGITMVISTHQMEDLLEVSHKISVIDQGRNAIYGSPKQVLSQLNKLKSLGLEPPVVTRIADALRQERHWPIPAEVVIESELIENLNMLLERKSP